MSSSLVYRPAVPVPVSFGGWGMPLKTLIVRRFWDEYADGSLTYRDPQIMAWDKDGQWLMGVRDGAGEQLREQVLGLLDALEEHGSIEIWVE